MNGKRVARNNRRSGGVVGHPPQLRQQLGQRYCFRFRAAANSSVTVTANSLLDLLAIATAATTGNRLIGAIRLREVEAWVSPSPLSASPTVITITGGLNDGTGALNRVTDTSMGLSEPAHVRWRPAPSDAALWYSAGSSAILFAVASANGVVILDVHVDLIFNVGVETTTAVSTALAGASAGVLYYHYLDGAAAVWIPEPGSLAIA